MTRDVGKGDEEGKGKNASSVAAGEGNNDAEESRQANEQRTM